MTHHPTLLPPLTGHPLDGHPIAGRSHTSAYPSKYPSEWQTLIEAGKTGAMVGTAGAVALNLQRMQREGIPWQTALRNTAQAGLYAGLATAAATAVSRMAGHNHLLTMVVSLTTGAAVMYALTNRRKEHGDA